MTAAAIKKPTATKAVDWAAMESLYRAGIVPLAQLSRDFGVSRAAIHKHAAKHAWIRAIGTQPSGADDNAACATWQDSARKTLDQLSDLLVGCYDVTACVEKLEPIVKITESAATEVDAMRARQGDIPIEGFHALLNSIRVRVEAACEEASKHSLPAWNAIAKEALRVVFDATPDMPNNSARDFECGRDLAIGMLRAGDELQGDGIVEAQRRFRSGKAQERFARGPLQELIAHPELLEGFSAVLSARLGVQDPLPADELDLPRAEYEPGEVGADGTLPHPVDDELPEAPPRPLAARTHCVAGTGAATDEAEGRRKLGKLATWEISQLADGLKRLLQSDDIDNLAYAGMLARISFLSDIVFHAADFDGSSTDAQAPQLADLERAHRGVL